MEILASLHAMPNMLPLRTADAIEHRTGPAALVFARQEVPVVRRKHVADNLPRRAYVLVESDGDTRAVTLLATGSEASIALQAHEQLRADGIATAVVSMPCCERFDEQDEACRASVLKLGAVRVAIEAAVRFGWDRYLGEQGASIGMTGFGASGPAGALYERFGITRSAVVAEAKRLLRSNHH